MTVAVIIKEFVPFFPLLPLLGQHRVCIYIRSAAGRLVGNSRRFNNFSHRSHDTSLSMFASVTQSVPLCTSGFKIVSYKHGAAGKKNKNKQASRGTFHFKSPEIQSCSSYCNMPSSNVFFFL